MGYSSSNIYSQGTPKESAFNKWKWDAKKGEWVKKGQSPKKKQKPYHYKSARGILVAPPGSGKKRK